jgi:ParB family chromosome partitioning protein
MRLLSLPEDIQRALADGKITEGHARAILSLETPGQQKQLFQRIVNHSLNVRDTEKTAKSYRMKTRHVQPEPIGLEEKRVTLQQSLSTKVEVKPNGRKGKVTIHYYSDEELQRLVSIIKKGSQI